MERPQLVNGLSKQHRRLRGKLADVEHRLALLRGQMRELEEREAEALKLNETLKAVETTIRLVYPAWEPTGTPIKPRHNPLRRPYGTYSKLAMEVLRDATRPMSATEIAKEAMRRLGELDNATHDEIAGVASGVRGTLLAKPKLVARAGKPPKFSLQPVARPG